MDSWGFTLETGHYSKVLKCRFLAPLGKETKRSRSHKHINERSIVKQQQTKTKETRF